jgi:hypothetical protein
MFHKDRPYTLIRCDGYRLLARGRRRDVAAAGWSALSACNGLLFSFSTATIRVGVTTISWVRFCNVYPNKEEVREKFRMLLNEHLFFVNVWVVRC